MMVELAEHAFLAQRFLEAAQALLVIGGAEVEEVALVLSNGGERSSSLALGLIEVGDADQAAEIRVTPQAARDQQQLGAVDLQGGADQRLDADLPACLQKLDRPIHAAPVSDRERRHLQLRGS